jgi:hypothetical protein
MAKTTGLGPYALRTRAKNALIDQAKAPLANETYASQHSYILLRQRKGLSMAGGALKFCALIVALGIGLAGCMPNGASNPSQAQYLATRTICQPGMHAISRMRGSGYRCVPD